MGTGKLTTKSVSSIIMVTQVFNDPLITHKFSSFLTVKEIHYYIITGADLGGRKVRRCVPMEILIIDILKL